MDPTVPPGAAFLLAFIAAREAPKGYDTVFANRMAKMPKPLTSMTVAEVIAQGPWRTSNFGSSACGRFQFMTATLQGLVKEVGLTGGERFEPDLQDRLAFHLLKRRGYVDFAAGRCTLAGFGLGLAKEWASFPVLADCQGAHRPVKRGQSFYAGDGLNKALVSADDVEKALLQVERINAGAASTLASPVPASPIPPVAVNTGKPDLKPVLEAQVRVTEAAVPPPSATSSPQSTGLLAGILARLRAQWPIKGA
ncbi:hypothetical protein [Methylobacterium sp. JK268]